MLFEDWFVLANFGPSLEVVLRVNRCICPSSPVATIVFFIGVGFRRGADWSVSLEFGAVRGSLLADREILLHVGVLSERLGRHTFDFVFVAVPRSCLHFLSFILRLL